MRNKNIFKEKLYNHTVPVREGLWDAIEAQLPPKKEDRVFPLFWFTLFASTLLAGALILGTFTKEQTNISLPANSNSAIVQNAIENVQANAASSMTSEINTNSISTPSVSIPANSAESISATTNTTTNNSTINKTTNVTTNTRKSAKGTNQTLAIENYLLETTETLQSNTENSTTATKGRNSTTTSLLVSADMAVSPDALEQRDITSRNPDPNCYKFSGNADKYALSADIFAGPGFSPRSFEDTAGESSIYANARKTTEHNQYSWSAGARVNLLFRNGLGARLGLTYTQTGDVFDYTDTLATQKSTRYDSFFAADGAFLYVDTVRFLVFGSLIKKIHNTYRYLDIPLLGSFEVPFGRSIFMINAGPVFNLTSSHEGQILDPNLHPGSITPGEPGEIPVYKTNLGLSIYMGAGIVFPLTDQISGLVEPSFLYRLKPVTLDSYSLKEHRHHASLNLGIRYHFD